MNESEPQQPNYDVVPPFPNRYVDTPAQNSPLCARSEASPWPGRAPRYTAQIPHQIAPQNLPFHTPNTAYAYAPAHSVEAPTIAQDTITRSAAAPSDAIVDYRQLADIAVPEQAPAADQVLVTRANVGRIILVAVVMFAATVAAGMYVMSGNQASNENTGADLATTARIIEAEPADVDEADEAMVPATEAEIADLVAEAKAAAEKGRFSEAAALLVDARENPEADSLRNDYLAKAKKDDQLLAQLGRQQQAGKNTAMLKTLNQIAALRPLSPQLKKLRAATRKKTTRKQTTASRSTATARRANIAKTVKPAKRASTTNKRPATAPRAPGSAPVTGGGATSTTKTTPKPPAKISSSEMPPMPDVPNTGSAPTSGIAAIAGTHAGH